MSNRRGVLQDAFSERSTRRFMVATAMADALSAGTKLVAMKYRMRPIEVIDALLTQVASYVQAQVPKEEWGDVGAILADEVQRRLSIRGDTGDEHYARRMV